MATRNQVSDTSRDLSQRKAAMDDALNLIHKQFGKGAIMRLGEQTGLAVEAISTGSLALDLALGIGGLPRGRIVEIYGPEGSGKTSVSLHVIAEAQKEGGLAAFIDAEHALDPTYAKALGVDIDDLLVSQPDTGEQGLEIADTLVRSGAMDVIVIDSVAALVPRAEIEGEMGDSHVGLQARLMSQALRKLAGSVSRSRTLLIFINQLREKVGVMFGCFSYDTPVTLADGTQERIGRIVTRRMPVEVLSYDFASGKVVPRRVVGWFDNGRTDRFLRFTVAKPTGEARFAATPNHRINTPRGWREARELGVGDEVLLAVEHRLSGFQHEVVRGSLMGDGSLRPGTGHPPAATLRMSPGPEDAAYLEWKASLFGNIPSTRDAGVVELTPLAELADLAAEVYGDARGRKTFTWDFLKHLTPLSLALWYMDAGRLEVHDAERGSARIEICVQDMTPETRARVHDYLRDTWGLEVRRASVGGRACVVLEGAAAGRFQDLVAPYIHPSMGHKLLPGYRGRFDVRPETVAPWYEVTPAAITDVRAEPSARSASRFDLEVEHSHNYFVDGVMVHNSPETTPGGRALKFYSSVRLDVRRIDSLKDGAEIVGSRVRVKVVKNKVASPFKKAEFDIQYGTGISKEGSLLDVALEHDIVRKSGAWYIYGDDQLGQGRENAKAFLAANTDIATEIELKIKDKLGLLRPPGETDDGAEPDER